MARSPFASMHDASDGRIEKTMAITPAEFVRGMERMAVMTRTTPDHEDAQQTWTVALGAGSATIAFSQLPPKTLGGLMKIMQARVALSFDNVSDTDRDDFIDTFDLTFQRGGG